MRGMYAWNCGSIPGRGVHFTAKHIKCIIRQDRKNTKYCLKMGIRKFYKAKRVAKAQTISAHTASSLISYLGWLKHCDSANFYKKHIQPYVNIKNLKEVVSNASRINRKTAYVPQVHN